MLYWFAMILTIVANLTYHLSQKMTPERVNPAFSLLCTYGVAIVCTLPLFFIYPMAGSLQVAAKQLNWAPVALGLSIVGLELGYLLAYRAGWNLSSAALYSNSGVTLLLIPIGLLLFRERLLPINWLGMALAFIGLILMSQRS